MILDLKKKLFFSNLIILMSLIDATVSSSRRSLYLWDHLVFT